MTKQEVLDSCPKCLERCEHYLTFCVNCGTKLRKKTVVPCTTCGALETLSGPFCIDCGNALTQGTADISPKAGLSTSFKCDPRKTSLNQSEVLLSSLASQDARTSLNRSLAFASLAGVAFGCLLFAMLKTWHNFALLSLSQRWTESRVVVYSAEPNASIEIAKTGDRESPSFQNMQGLHKDYLLGESDAQGSFATKHAEPGNYILTVSAPGKKAALRPLTIGQNCPTIIGYPEKIQLPNEEEN